MEMTLIRGLPCNDILKVDTYIPHCMIVPIFVSLRVPSGLFRNANLGLKCQNFAQSR